ncbi:MAG: hypothetical protein J0I93_08580 [Legionella sp.]|nr:hypothetical protein [Legionella sp.]
MGQPCTTGVEPVPGKISVAGDNTNNVFSNVMILGYGCIHQAGYVYSLSETTNPS